MSWLWTILAGILGATVGGGGVLLMSSLSVRWHRITSFEGASGYFVVGLTLCGILLGSFVGMVAARVVHAGVRPEWWAQLSAGVLATAVLVGVATLVSYMRADRVPTRHGNEMTIEWEVRLPTSHDQIPEWLDDELRLQLVSTVGSGRRPSGARDAEFDRAAFRQEDGQWILPASVPVFTSKGVFCVNLTMGGRDDGFWPICGPIPHAHEWSWSDWRPTNKSNGKPDAEAVMYRYRFVKSALSDT